MNKTIEKNTMEIGSDNEYAMVMAELECVKADANDLSLKVKQNDWRRIEEISSWVSEKGYHEYQTAKQEYILQKPYAYFHIVLRLLFGMFLIMIEMTDDIAEAVQDKMSLGLSLENPSTYPMWCDFRNQNQADNSICTRMMPRIVGSLLINVYHIENPFIVNAFRRRLIPFGTKHFGVRDFNISHNDVDYMTPYHICYAPGEIEAITDVSARMLEGVKDVQDVELLDMNVFKNMLKERVAGIGTTTDVALFGRKLYRSGLNEYESAMHINVPYLIG